MILAILAVAAAQKFTPVVLKLNLHAGDRFEYSTEVHMTTGKPGDMMHATLQISERVVASTASFVEISHFVQNTKVESRGALSGSASIFEGLKGTSYQSKQDLSGKPLEPQATTGAAAATSWDIILPTEPVGPGSRWTSDLTVNGKLIHVTYHFNGREMVRGKRAYKIVRTIQPGQDLVDVDPTQIWLSPTDGRIVRSVGKFTVDSAGPKFTFTHKVQRLDGAKESANAS